jgi:phosphotransferase system enzyme I (PtsI)
MEQILQGTGVVPGIGIATVKVVSSDLAWELRKYTPGTPKQESGKMADAIEAAGAELLQLKEAAQAAGQQNQADIMDAHYTMMNDPSLAENINGRIEQGAAAPQAALEAAEEFAVLFDSMDDSYMRERAADVRDIGRRLARLLVGAGQIQYGPESVVLCAQEIEPSVAAGMPDGKVQAIMLGQGSATSHTVIIAKARSIPAVTGLGDVLTGIKAGTVAIVDGYSGKVILEPTSERLADYQKKVEAEAARRQRDSQMASLAAVTKSGKKLQLAANIGSPADMDAARKQGAEGVGLFRSEFLFLGRDVPPNEEEQFTAYKAAAEQCDGHLCVIRTMDIGGDKPLRYLNINQEENPFLGWRAIRISLGRPELFITQLKAILRAGAFGKVAIMLPMISSTAEIVSAKRFVEQAKAELSQEGKAFDPAMPLGIMIETPAAAVTAGELAIECDFFSIGTNDLVQYTLAVDRGNPAVSPLYSHFHPAVLRLIHGVVKAGHAQGIRVGMCGEMAGDPLAAPILTAMGFDELSMSAPAIPRVKEVIRQFEDEQLQRVLNKALTLNDAGNIRSLLEAFIQQ